MMRAWTRTLLHVAALLTMTFAAADEAIAQRRNERFEHAPVSASTPAPMASGLEDTHARTGFLVGGTIGAFAAGALGGLACLALDGSLVDCGVAEAARAVLTGAAIGGASGGALGFLIGALIPRTGSYYGGGS